MEPYDKKTGTNPPKDTIMRIFPLTWTALHLGLASAATYLLVASEVLGDASIFLIH